MEDTEYKVEEHLFLNYCVQDLFLKMKALEYFQKQIGAEITIYILQQFLYLNVNDFLTLKPTEESLRFQYQAITTGVFMKGMLESKKATDYYFKTKNDFEKYLETLQLLNFINTRTNSNKEAVRKMAVKPFKETPLYKEADRLLRSTFKYVEYA